MGQARNQISPHNLYKQGFAGGKQRMESVKEVPQIETLGVIEGEKGKITILKPIRKVEDIDTEDIHSLIARILLAKHKRVSGE